MSRIDEWFDGAVGRGMNLDGAYGYQCADVANDYCNYLFGKWQGGIIGRGNAKDMFPTADTTYWERIHNDLNNYDLIPQRGDVIFWGASKNNPYGHVAVVESADKSGATVIEQDGFKNTTPAYRAKRGYVYAGMPCIGWLRPRFEKIIGYEDSTNDESIKSMYLRLLGREADEGGIKHYQNIIKTKGFEFAYLDLKNSDEGQKDWAWRSPEAVRKLEADLNVKGIELAKIKQELLDEQAKPPKVVEKIVEKPVEKIVYVDKIIYKDKIIYRDKPCATESWLNRLIKKLCRK